MITHAANHGVNYDVITWRAGGVLGARGCAERCSRCVRRRCSSSTTLGLWTWGRRRAAWTRRCAPSSVSPSRWGTGCSRSTTASRACCRTTWATGRLWPPTPTPTLTPTRHTPVVKMGAAYSHSHDRLRANHFNYDTYSRGRKNCIISWSTALFPITADNQISFSIVSNCNHQI